MRGLGTKLAVTCAASLLLALPGGGTARAQSPHGGSNSMEEEFRKKAEEISRLMRESEQLLLQITRVDELVAKQDEIARRLAELERDEPADPSAAEGAGDPERAEAARAERERKRRELEQEQAEVERRLAQLFERQGKAGEESVARLIELLSSLPTGGGGGGGGHERPPPDPQQRQQEEQQEQKQEQPRDGNEQRDRSERERRGSEREPEETGEGARLRRIEAWIASLPPALQERINRNDLSAIPVRYRRLVREYTALRAQREAERAEER